MLTRLRIDPPVTSSVFCHLPVTFTPVGAQQQPSNRSGFPSGSFGSNKQKQRFQRTRRIALSTESGFVTKAGNIPDTWFRRQALRFCKGALCNFYATERAARSSRFTNTRPNQFQFQEGRP